MNLLKRSVTIGPLGVKNFAPAINAGRNITRMTIEGVWYNELGSMVDINVNGPMLTGGYQSAVGAGGTFPMVGMTDPAQASGQTFGMVVAWNNGTSDLQSTTAWCGQLQIIDGQETLTTMWLLSQATEPVDNWESLLIGQDVFTRSKPSRETMQKAAEKRLRNKM